MRQINFRKKNHIVVQSAIRTAFAKKQFLPRMKGMEQMDELLQKVTVDTPELVEQLTASKGSGESQVKAFKETIEANIEKIKVSF